MTYNKPLLLESPTYDNEMVKALMTQQQPAQQQQQGGGMPMVNPQMFMGGGSGGGASSAGGASSMGWMGPAALIAAAVAATKGYEHRNPDSTFSKTFGRFNAPTYNQIKADPKTALTGILTGTYPLMYDKMNREAKAAKPEWEDWLGY